MSNFTNDIENDASKSKAVSTAIQSAVTVLYTNLIIWITRGAGPMLLMFGTAGNVLQIIVLSKWDFKYYSRLFNDFI